MPTIGYKWSGPPGDHTAICGYCGVAWHRSEMTKDAAGNLVCPDEGGGLDRVMLSKMEARERLRLRQRPIDGRTDTSGPSATGLPRRALDWDDLVYENASTRYAWYGYEYVGAFAADLPAIVTHGQKRRVLVGPGLTNLETYSGDANRWSVNGTAGVAANSGAAPDGTATAALVRVSGSGNGVGGAWSLSDNTYYTASAFYRYDSGDRRFLRLVQDQAGTQYAVHLQAEDSWKRSVFSFDSSSGASSEAVVYTSQLAGSANGFYIWGRQLTQSRFGSSYYVPTTTASVTQPADKASMPTTADFLTKGWRVSVTPDFGSADVLNGSGNSYYIFYVDTDQYLRLEDDSDQSAMILEWATPGGTITMSNIGSFGRGKELTIECDFLDGYMSVTGSSLPQRQNGTVTPWTGGTVYVGMDSSYGSVLSGWIAEPLLLDLQRTTAADL